LEGIGETASEGLDPHADSTIEGTAAMTLSCIKDFLRLLAAIIFS
jgi:hypothetical protein